jgi:lipopolysaccharide export LptBFGC system permease protein LptF
MGRMGLYIMRRMAVNFLVLFTLLFVLGAMIDLIVNLDEFDEIARSMSADGGFITRVGAIIRVAFGFEGPRVFQVYAYLHGLIAIGAMGFTLTQMHRAREFVALMAAGIALHRVAVPIVLVMLAASVLQLVNQEVMLPRVAPLLLRGHGEASMGSAKAFMVPFTPDRSGTLLLSPSLDPLKQVMAFPTFLERDQRGRTTRRIHARSASWDEDRGGWSLRAGSVMDVEFDVTTGEVSIAAPQSIDFYRSELSPHLLTLHRYGQYLGMLGMSQLNEMLGEAAAFDEPLLRRHWFARFATIALNLLAMLVALPFFLTREPIVVMRRAMWCASAGIAMMIGGALVMLSPMPGVPSMVSVFLPAIVLLPIALGRVAAIRT